MSMNEFLAQFYGTNTAAETEKTAAAEEAGEQEKIAMFAKIAKDNGIDLSKLSDEKIDALYSATFSKEAGEMPPQFAKKDDGEKKEEKKDEKDEEAEKKAAAAADEERLEKQAQEADWMGRVMAHAYVNEMRKIASDVEAKVTEETKTASIRDRLLKLASEDKGDEKKDEKKDDKGDKGEKSLPPWMKDKEASALNESAVEHALAIVQDFNKTAAAQGQQVFDVKVAAERLAAVHTLGLSDSEKVASAENVEQATAIRALEYLEAAGYPVTWPQ